MGMNICAKDLAWCAWDDWELQGNNASIGNIRKPLGNLPETPGSVRNLREPSGNLPGSVGNVRKHIEVTQVLQDITRDETRHHECSAKIYSC